VIKLKYSKYQVTKHYVIIVFYLYYILLMYILYYYTNFRKYKKKLFQSNIALRKVIKELCLII